MLTNIPLANFYQLSSYEAPTAPIAVGGLMMMNEVGTMLEDKDIVLEMGYTDEECYLLVNLPFEEITAIVDKARANVDEALKSKSLEERPFNETD
jgi:hypothetical protein